MTDPASGRLMLAGTPIGNSGDATVRLCAALTSADVIAAEDTRRLRRLAKDLNVTTRGRVVSLHDSVEAQRVEGLLADLAAGRDVLVVSDAGMPAISDPGYRLVRAAVAADVPIVVLPGPSAVLAALVASGLPVDRFCFEGFLPRKSGERTRRLQELATERRTMVFFEAPHRLAAMLNDLAAVFGGQRPAALCRELTKTYEEVRRDTVGVLLDHVNEHGVRGEITLVVQGAPAPEHSGSPAEWAEQVADLIALGTDRKAAMVDVANASGVSRREVYDAVVAARLGGPPP